MKPTPCPAFEWRCHARSRHACGYRTDRKTKRGVCGHPESDRSGTAPAAAKVPRHAACVREVERRIDAWAARETARHGNDLPPDWTRW